MAIKWCTKYFSSKTSQNVKNLKNKPQAPPGGSVLTCNCGLLLPMPLHSARARESVPRVSRHKLPCLSTLDTASCSGTLREPLMVKGLITPIKSRWIELISEPVQLSNRTTGNEPYDNTLDKSRVTVWGTVIWRNGMEQIEPARRGMGSEKQAGGIFTEEIR